MPLKSGGTPAGYAFVRVKTVEEAEGALRELDRKRVLGQEVFIHRSTRQRDSRGRRSRRQSRRTPTQQSLLSWDN